MASTDIDTDRDLAAELKQVKAELAKQEKDHASLRNQLRDAESKVESLTDDLRTTRAEARDRRHEEKALREQLKEREDAIAAKEAELSEVLAGFGELDEEFTQFRTQAEAQPNELLEQVNKYKGELRKTRHERTFDQVLADLNVKDAKKRADLLKLAGYEADDDEPNIDKIREVFSEVIKERPWYVDANPTVTDSATATGQANATTANGSAGGANGANGTAAQQTNGHTSTANGNGTATSGQAAGSNGKPGPGADRGSSLGSGQTAAPSGRIAGRI